MKKTKRAVSLLSGAALALALLGASGEAFAAGVALDPSALDARTRTALKTEIEAARATTPELFKAVVDVAARAREIDAAARAPGVPFTMQLKPLGQRALYPMLELLVFDAHTDKDLPASARSALRLGLIEAVGAIRDARAIPVLAKLLEDRDNATVRASAEGLARIGTDEAVELLMSAAAKAKTPAGSDRERALLSGMHDARRERAARFLAKRLSESPDAETARVVVKALGGVGNAWAWKTLSSQAEASATRSVAAGALVDAYVTYVGEVRAAAAKAILVVDDASTPARIAQARRTAPRDVAAALDELDRRLSNNPAR